MQLNILQHPGELPTTNKFSDRPIVLLLRNCALTTTCICWSGWLAGRDRKKAKIYKAKMIKRAQNQRNLTGQKKKKMFRLCPKCFFFFGPKCLGKPNMIRFAL